MFGKRQKTPIRDDYGLADGEFQHGCEHKTNDECDERVLELAHEIAEHGKRDCQADGKEALIIEVGACQAEQHKCWQNDRLGDRQNARKQAQAKSSDEQIGEVRNHHRSEHAVNEPAVVIEQPGAWCDAVNDERAHQQSRSDVSWNTQRQKRNQVGPDDGAVGRFGSSNAFLFAIAEALRISGGTPGGTVAEKSRDRRVNLTVAFNPPADSRIAREPLLEEEMFCIGRADIIGKTSKPIRLAEMATLPVVLLKSGALVRGLTDRPSLVRKIDEAAHIRLASVAATIGALENGLGCTLAPRSLIDERLRSKKLRARKLSDKGMTRTLYLGHLESDEPTREREVVRELIREITASVVEEGQWPAARALLAGD